MRLRIGLTSLLLALPACGAHLHRPHDAAAAEQAEVELKGARLTEGFAPELAQAAEMLTQELAAARAWAQTGRDRDLLDVLSATAVDENDPETEILLHPRCRGRFKGDGWSTLCSKLTRRIEMLGGLTLPLGQVVASEVKPPAKAGRKDVARASTAPDPLVQLLGELRRQMRAWHGPQSDAARLAKAGTDFVVMARAAGLSAGSSPAPRCPDTPARPGVARSPEVDAEAARVRGLCTERRNNLVALKTASCAGVAGCTGGLLARQAEAVLAVHDALALHDGELARRLDAYAAARGPCETTGPSGQVHATAAPSSAGPAGPVTCDATQVDRAFAAIGQIPTPALLEARGFGVLVRQGRAIQLGEQIAALDQLIEAREDRPDPTVRPSRGGATLSPALARALHGTIEGIDRVQRVADAFEMAVLTLIRETLRVERAALDGAIGHAERRRRIDVAKLAAQLDEYTQLIAAYIDLQRAERAGCAARPIVEVQAQDGCRDETTRMLLAYSNAWTLGRAGQQQADVLELGVRHEASIDRSRAAMAVREVYLAAGVAELAKFNRGGIRPEVLAQIIVSAVGFGVVAGGVY